MSVCRSQLLGCRVAPFAVMLLALGLGYPAFGQEAKPSPTNAPQAKPSPLPTASPLPEKKDEKEEEESRVLVAEVVVKGAKGKLQEEAYKAVKTKPGKEITRSQLQEDINAIFATGYFSNVRAVPEDVVSSDLRMKVQTKPNLVLQQLKVMDERLAAPQLEDVNGVAATRLAEIKKVSENSIPTVVRVTFEVEPNPILKTVQVESKKVLPTQLVEEIFQKEYGKILNLNQLEDGIKQINRWYQDNGYVLAKVLDSPAVSKDGVVTLQVAEGEIEAVQVRYIDNEGNDKDKKGKLSDSVVLQAVQTKTGQTFIRPLAEQDMKRILVSLGFQDVRLGLEPSRTDPRKVIVVVNVVETKDEAERLFNSAGQLGDEKTDKSRQQAIATYQELLQLHRKANDQPNEAIVLNRIAAVYYDLEEYPQALDLYNQSLRLAKAINLPALEVLTLNNIGNTYYAARNYSQAFDFYSQALQLSQSLQGSSIRDIEARVVFGFGQSSTRGRFSDISLVPIRLKPAAVDASVISYSKPFTLFRLGELYQLLGDYQQALYLFKSALPQWETLAGKDKDYAIAAIVYKLLEVFNLAYLASLYADLGDEGQASIYRNEAEQGFLRNSEEFKKEFGDMFSIVNTLLDSASNVDGQEQSKFLNQIQLFLKSSSGEELAALVWIRLGDSYVEQSDYSKAVKAYEQALSLLNNLKDPKTKETALNAQVKALNGMGKVYAKGTSQQKAIEFHQKAIAMLQASNLPAKDLVALQAETLNLLGQAYFRVRQFSQARKAYTQAISVGTTAKDLAKVAESLLGMAEIERAMGNFAQAQTQIEAALTQLELQPLQPSTQPSSSVRTFADGASRKTVTILRTKPVPSASKRSSDFNFYKDLTAFLAAKQNYYEFDVDLLMERYRQTGAKQYETQAFLASERAKAQSLRMMLKRRDRPNDSSSSTLPTSASLREIQASLDDDTILLEFFLGKQRSYLWAVTKDDISSYVLPPQSQIDLASRQFYEYLTNPSLRVRPDSTAQMGMNLSQLILGSVAPKLVGKKRILVVSDGGLQYIPFSTLPIPLAGVNSSKPNLASIVDPLLVRHEVVNLPSASTLIAIRQNQAKRIAPTKTLAVLADPIFGREDERLGVAQVKQLADGEQFYPRLPGTQRQAEQILALVPEALRSQKFGFDASRQTALSPDLGKYKIVHFATHGILDSQRPERSGMILSMVNQRGELQRSLLSPPDIFNMLKLSADLVVLNGCRTGLGTVTNKESFDRDTYQIQATFQQAIQISATEPYTKKIATLNGEGVVGLTGSFLYAGADRVVASLWSVEEKATSDLMVRFYTNMLNGREGKKLTPAAALREAQLSMWKERRWESPYDWAGFVLQGEWR